jgi:hypothetical protein
MRKKLITCHPERSEGLIYLKGEILCYAQIDNEIKEIDDTQH